jgi:DNA mismatch repair protein MSH3
MNLMVGHQTDGLTADSQVRTELETRLTHLQPAELLLPMGLSKATEKVLNHFAGNTK